MADDYVLPEGALVKVEILVRLPVAATWHQVKEWLPYSLCNTGGCSLDNPLLSHDATYWGSNGFKWREPTHIGTTEEFDHTAETFRRRFVTTPIPGRAQPEKR